MMMMMTRRSGKCRCAETIFFLDVLSPINLNKLAPTFEIIGPTSVFAFSRAATLALQLGSQRVSSRWFFPAHKKASAQHIDDDDSDDDETGEGDGDIDGDGDDDHDDNNIDDGSTDDSKDDDGAIWKSFLRRDLFFPDVLCRLSPHKPQQTCPNLQKHRPHQCIRFCFRGQEP